MGPLLHHGTLIKIMDSEVGKEAGARYAGRTQAQRSQLLAYFSAQDSEIDGGKRLNLRKFTELPYQSSQLEPDTFDTSDFLTDLGWIQNKISCTGCSGLLYDLSLAAKQQSQQKPHLVLLRELITSNYTALNYDGSMLTIVVSNYVRDCGDEFETRLAPVPAIRSKWLNFVQHLSGTCLMPLNNVQCGDETTQVDMIFNSSVAGNFILALSKDGNELSVWDVKKYFQV